MAVCSGTINFTTGGIGKGKGFPGSLVAVGAVGVIGQMYLGQRILISLSLLPHSSLIRKGNPSTAGLSETHFQLPAERSRIRTCNFMYYYGASLIIWDCVSEIN